MLFMGLTPFLQTCKQVANSFANKMSRCNLILILILIKLLLLCLQSLQIKSCSLYARIRAYTRDARVGVCASCISMFLDCKHANKGCFSLLRYVAQSVKCLQICLQLVCKLTESKVKEVILGAYTVTSLTHIFVCMAIIICPQFVCMAIIICPQTVFASGKLSRVGPILHGESRQKTDILPSIQLLLAALTSFPTSVRRAFRGEFSTILCAIRRK